MAVEHIIISSRTSGLGFASEVSGADLSLEKYSLYSLIPPITRAVDPIKATYHQLNPTIPVTMM
jgi:hypothetical protein